MTHAPSLFRPLAAHVAATAMLASAVTSEAAASAYVVAEADIAPVSPIVTDADPTAGEVMVAATDCYAVGQQVAAQKGGELYGANAANQGGQDVCVVVVVIPAKDGQRPRRVEVVVPAG